jgi:poly(3-hydroxybutyrate) depolymerase
MAMSLRFFAAVASLVLAPSAAGAQDVDGFAARSFKAANGVTMLYRLFIPSAEQRKKALPLVVYLHGSGGIGDDNLKQISGGNGMGTHVWTTPDAQRRHPTYVLAPQLPQGEQWVAPGSDGLSSHAEALVQLIAALTREFFLDPDRVYLTGQSLGGRGTWDIISKRPDLFAAAVPLCGDGNPRASPQRGGLPSGCFMARRTRWSRSPGRAIWSPRCVPWAAPSNTRSTQTWRTTCGLVPTWIRSWPTGSSPSGGSGSYDPLSLDAGTSAPLGR